MKFNVYNFAKCAVYRCEEQRSENLARSKELKKNKLIWALFILLGALAVFTYIILYNGRVALKKTNSTEVIQIQNTIDGVKGKSIVEKKKVISDVINKLVKVINDSRESAKKKELEKLKAEVEKIAQKKKQKAQEQIEIKRIALIKVKNELSDVYSQVVTSKEQKLITIMSSTLSKIISNPSYNYTSDKASIMSIYGTLNSESRDRVKSALFWNIDGDSITQLRQTFGL